MLSIKNLVFKEKSVKKLIKRCVKPYIVKMIVSKNTVKLKLPAFIRFYSVMNVSRIVRYKKPMKKQKAGEPKPVVEKILNKRKVQRVIKYLM